MIAIPAAPAPLGNDLDVMDVFLHKLQCIDQSCQRDNSGTMLIIMEDRDIAALFELLLDLEAARCTDVLKIYATKAACQQSDCIYDVIHILAAYAERNCVYSAECLEQHTLSFHNRHTSLRSDISKAENCRTVCYNCYSVPAACQLIALIDILLNLQARLCYARCVCERKSLLVVYRRSCRSSRFYLSVHNEASVIPLRNPM